jgi:hypothetical protein
MYICISVCVTFLGPWSQLPGSNTKIASRICEMSGPLPLVASVHDLLPYLLGPEKRWWMVGEWLDGHFVPFSPSF